MKGKAIAALAALCVALALLAAVLGVRCRRVRSALSEAQARGAALEVLLSDADGQIDALQGKLDRAESDALALRSDAQIRSDAAQAAEEHAAALESELEPFRRAEAIRENSRITEHAQKTKHLNAFRYLLYEPGVPSDEPLPLLLFLHGTGGCGTDISDVYADDTLPTMLRLGWLSPDALVLIPQCPEENWTAYCEDLMELMEAVIDEYGADRARVSVTGFSLGGIGCFSMLTRYPDYFAAAMPLGALCDPGACACITSTQVRILHGELDRSMDPLYVTLANDVINSAGGHSTLTFIPGEKHFIQQHYLDDGGEPVEWLISQRRSG